MHAIEINALTKEYKTGFWRNRSKLALDGLSLKVEAGEIFGLLGHNGAGKTTTLKLLFRLVFPTSGTAYVLGKQLSDAAMHQRVGYLPENPYFYDHLSPEELLDYSGRLFGLRGDELRLRIGLLLDRVSLSKSRRVPLRRFSKGMVQRAGIAQALINNPDVIFLDEPMSGLDPVGRREVRDLILQLKSEGKTVFFSTHILSDAEALCDRVAILAGGELQGCGELHQILSMGTSATEITIERPPAEVQEKTKPLAVSSAYVGDLVRMEIRDETNVEKVLRICLDSGIKVVSVNPIKMTLEDYFLSQVSPETLKGMPFEGRD